MEQYRSYDYEFERYWHFFQLWGRLGCNPDTPADVWSREFRRRFGAAAPHVEAGLHRASQVLPMIVAAVYPYSAFPTTRGWAERQSLGASLAEYADNESSDVELFESFAGAAKRILADGVTAIASRGSSSLKLVDCDIQPSLNVLRMARRRRGAGRRNAPSGPGASWEPTLSR